jgi:hypothetical protein
MTTSNRFLMSLILVTACVVGMGSTQPSWMAALGLQAASRSASGPTTECLPREPGSQHDVVYQRILAKGRIIESVLTGEMDLFEAAAWFGLLNATPAQYPDRFWKTLPGASDGEKLCNQVISWTRGQLNSHLSRCEVEARVHELADQLQQHLACHGSVQLPDVLSARN